MKILTALALAASVAACATAPKPLQGQFSAVIPSDAARTEASGELVRWGGRIVSVQPESQRTCFEIVGAPLDASGRPRKVDRSDGRFFACRLGFYEPQVFQPGREITISGHLEGVETRKVGDFDYRYPRVAADVVYLWPERRARDVYVRPSLMFGWSGRW